MIKPIIFKNRELTLHKAINNPCFESKTVLTDSCWRYVEMWLRRKNAEKALFYWKQAEQFFKASTLLPLESSPLTTYYCFLNATKALLFEKGVLFNDKRHGISGGRNPGNKVTLIGEQVTFQMDGVLPGLCKYLGEPVIAKISYRLKNILYNLPYIHRAYCLTFTSDDELFFPISKPRFVKNQRSHDAWFEAILDSKYSNQHTINKLPTDYIRDSSYNDKCVIRYNRIFTWNPNDRTNSIQNLKTYHSNLRKDIYYIYGPTRLWYIKRNQTPGIINRSSLTLTLAAMHRLSELSRYSPHILAKHLESQHNWLLSEFIEKSLYQF
ncbi:MAG: YaaC family protein, partial [Bacteroidota bacterium]